MKKIDVAPGQLKIENVYDKKEMVKYLFECLHNFEELYLVGGSVRDLLLNKEVFDYDFAVPYTPEEIKKKFEALGIEKIYDIGQKFGTIGCLIDNKKVEITTFRGEQYNYINRKPEVSYINTIEEDVKRRDFTINAIYINRDDIHKPDFFSKLKNKNKHLKQCIDDLNIGFIRTVGDPGKRFREDPLRMLRAVRFSSQLGFTIEDKTFEMIQRLRSELLKISVERWTEELDKILSLKRINFSTLADSCLLDIILPELSYQINFDQNSKYHNFNLWEHTARVVNLIPKDNLYLRWAGLLHDIGKPFVQIVNKKGNTNYMGHEVMSVYLVQQIGVRLKWSKERTKRIKEIVETHSEKYNILKEFDDKSKGK